jgi:Flp pilus assembly protein TadG
VQTTLKKLKPKQYKSLLNYFRNQRGSVTPAFALALIPILATAGVAMDYDRTLMANDKLRAIADAASLAGASYDGTPAQQKTAAEAFLLSQKVKLGGLTYSSVVTTPTKKVEVVITGELKGSFLPIVFSQAGGSGTGGNTPWASGNGGLNVRSRAVYTTKGGGLVCMLTLNANADSAMYFSGSGDITATNCGFQSNSSDLDQALHLQGSAKATADFFNAVGGWDITGNRATFSTTPEAGVDVFSDPFKIDPVCPAGAGTTITASGSSEASPTSLSDSVYNDITVRNNKYAEFTPGIHYIKGTINMTGGLLKGIGVTLVLCGANAKINMNGGDLKLQAPTTGLYKGFAVIGNSTATNGHELQGGPGTFIRGIFYTPKAGVTVSGNSDFNVNSNYFPIVADTIKLTGSGKVNIGIDAAAYGFELPTQLTLPTQRYVWLDR